MDYTTVFAKAMQTLEQRKDRSALVYDGDIAAALCNPSELKKTRNGERRPNSQEEWLDVQARALRQAFRRVYSAIRAARQEVQQ